jgi:hypothetical protein
MRQLFKTSGIIIDDAAVNITKHPDGSMLFSDMYVDGVKLKDIIGGTVIIDPSVLVQIDAADWELNEDTDLYEIEAEHSFALVGTQKAQVLVVTMNLDYEQIIMDTVKVQENSVFITSTEAIDMYVTIKRI